MADLRYQELNLYQIYDILRQAYIARLALSADDQPYVIPMHMQWQLDGGTSILHMATSADGHKVDILGKNDRVAVEIERDTCVGTDVVLAQGRCLLLPDAAGLRLAVLVSALSGRRYFLTDGE